MIWDKIISEANRFRPYLNFISDQEDALEMDKKKGFNSKGRIFKRLVGVAQNAVNFLSILSNKQTRRYDMQNRLVVISGSRKVIGK